MRYCAIISTNAGRAHSHVRYSEFAGTDAGFSLALDLYRNECIARWPVEPMLILLYTSKANTVKHGYHNAGIALEYFS